MRFLAYSNMWIAFAAFSHCVCTYLLFEMDPDWVLATFVFCSTLFLYNFLRIMKIKTIPSENHSEQLKWVSKQIKWVSFLTIGACLGGAILFFFLSYWQMFIVMLTGIIGLGYNLVITRGGMSLRKIPFMKGIWISLVWTLITLELPLSANEFHFSGELFLLRFLFIYMLTIPFDIRDLKYDEQNMKTIPQFLGVKGAVFFGWILVATCCCLAFHIFEDETALLLSLSYFLTGIVLLFSLGERKEIFYPMVVDGMIVVQMLLIVGNSF